MRSATMAGGQVMGLDAMVMEVGSKVAGVFQLPE